MEVLRLSENHISALHESTFADLPRLRVLTLASNRLRAELSQTAVLTSPGRVAAARLNPGFKSTSVRRCEDVCRSASTSRRLLPHFPVLLFCSLCSRKFSRSSADFSPAFYSRCGREHQKLRFQGDSSSAGLRQLRTLSLANNRIQFLADGAFQHLVRLRTLNPPRSSGSLKTTFSRPAYHLLYSTARSLTCELFNIVQFCIFGTPQ